MAAILFHQSNDTSPKHGSHFVSSVRCHQSRAWRPFCFIYQMTPVPIMAAILLYISDASSPKHGVHFVSSIRWHHGVSSMAANLFPPSDDTRPEHGGHFVSSISWHQSQAWRPFCFIYHIILVPSMAAILFHLSDDTSPQHGGHFVLPFKLSIFISAWQHAWLVRKIKWQGDSELPPATNFCTNFAQHCTLWCLDYNQNNVWLSDFLPSLNNTFTRLICIYVSGKKKIDFKSVQVKLDSADYWHF